MNIKNRKALLFFTMLVLFAGCGKRQVTLCSIDGKKCISIEDRLNSRIIYFEPDIGSDFVKLDITSVDLETEGIFICWRNESNQIEVLCPKTSVLDEDYNTELYKFDNKLRINERGIPNINYYHKEGCLEYNIVSNLVFPENHAVAKK